MKSSSLRIVTTVPKWEGHNAADLSAEFYDEICKISKKVSRIYVITPLTKQIAKEIVDPRLSLIIVRPSNIPKLRALIKIVGYTVTLASLCLGRRINLVYIGQFSPPDLLLSTVGRVLRLPVVLSLGGTWLFAGAPTLKNRFLRFVLRSAVRDATRIILYSPLMIPEVKLFATNLDVRKIRFVPKGVDISRFRPSKPDSEILDKYGVMQNRIILYAGRVNEKKGVEELVRALPSVREKHDAKLLIAGIVDATYLCYLETLISDLGVEDSVIVAGPIPNNKMPELFGSSDVFAFMSRGGEGMPRVLLEAMACEKPVIATATAGIPDVVKDGINGFTVKVGDYADLARKIIKILDDKDLAGRLGSSARQTVERTRSWQVVVPRLLDCLADATH